MDAREKTNPALMALAFTRKMMELSPKYGMRGMVPWEELDAARRALLTEVCKFFIDSWTENDKTPSGMIMVSPIVSHLTRGPIVQVQWDEKAGQMSVAEARQMGMQFLEVATCAEHDSLLYECLDALDNPEHENVALGMLQQMRELRDKHEKESLNAKPNG